MAASRARLEALLARVQKRATEPRSPSAAVAPVLEAVKGGASRSPPEASDAPASVRAAAARSAQSSVTQNAGKRSIPHKSIPHNSFPYNQVTDDDIEEYDDELIEIIDDAEVIPQAAAAARAIEPAAFGAAVDRRPAAPIRAEPIRPEPVAARAARAGAEPLRAETVAPRPVAASEVARARGTRRELRHTSFVELLEASLKLG